MARLPKKLLFVVLAAPLAVAAVPSLSPLSLPDSKGGIGYDDLLFSSALNRVLVPSGRTGMLNLIDPKTHTIRIHRRIQHRTVPARWARGRHDLG